MGTKPVNTTVRFGGWEGTGSRVNHEPEDLPGELTDVPSWAGELARMSCGSNPQGLCKALGIFLFGLQRIPYKSMGRILARSQRAACDVVGAGGS